MPHVDVGEHQWRNGRTVLTWNCWGTAGAFADSKTVIERQSQNAPGTWICLAGQFEKFLDFIHFEVSSAVYLNCLIPLSGSHKQMVYVSRYGCQWYTRTSRRVLGCRITS
jgi:hypothetical protein